jgi:predicted ester cyclase
MFEENIATSQRLLTETFGEGKVDLIDEHSTENYVAHDQLSGDQDREASKQSVLDYRGAFPDLTFTIEDAFAADDKVVLRWSAMGTFENALMGIEPTGESGDPIRGITIDRFEDGLIAESWTSWDTLTLMRNMGVVGQEAAAA